MIPADYFFVAVRDIEGVKGISTWRVVPNTLFSVLSSTRTAYLALAECDQAGVEVARTSVEDPGTSGGDGPYATARDLAILAFACDDGTQVRVTIVSPKESVFLGDAETVNANDPAVALFITRYIAAPTTNSTQSPVTRYLRGWRARAGV